MASLKWKNANPAAKVDGPIRCHACRKIFRDAEQYLNHKCEPKAGLTDARQPKEQGKLNGTM